MRAVRTSSGRLVSRGQSMMQRAIVLFVLVSIGVPVSAQLPGQEEDYPVIASRWGLELGGTAVDLQTSAAVGFGSSAGTFINLEELLGLDTSQQTFRLDGFYRIKPRHTLDFGYLSLNRTATKDLQEQFSFGGREFELGAALTSTFDMDLLRVLYEYSFINNGRVNAGLAAGLSTFLIKGQVTGEAILRDDHGNEIGTGFTTERTSLLAPVPSFGMFVEYGVTKWAILRLRAGSLNLHVGDIKGRFVDVRATMDFYFTDHVAIGVGLHNTDLRYTDVGEDPVQVDYRYEGVSAHLGLSF